MPPDASRASLYTSAPMLLQPDPSLAEVPGFSQEQLDRLARSVESRRRQLESDIDDYIRAKQHELRSFERQLVEQHRSMECVDDAAASAEANPASVAENAADPHAVHEHVTLDTDAREPHERVKRTKHGKVKKREQELYGLVTPAFLPLLDARDSSPTSHKDKKEKKTAKLERVDESKTVAGAGPTATSRNAEKSKDGRKTKKEVADMDAVTAADQAKQHAQAETAKKSKRSGIKKSALRHKDTPRSRRKRVSLVIDGQTVLPADTVIEPPLTSPSSEATSASNSTASLDDLIDPRLMRSDSHDAVHHSLPVPMSTPHAPSKPLAETPSSLVIETDQSPPLRPPPAPRTFLSPPTTHIPRTAGPEPIYPTEQLEPTDLDLSIDDDSFSHGTDPDQDANANWGTYVGGLHGSGVDDVDQAGSYGYPSSLGASYLESYMQSRPLSVRMQRGGKDSGRGGSRSTTAQGHQTGGQDDEEENEDMGRRRGNFDDDDEEEEEEGIRMDARRGKEEDDDMDITGSMEF